VNVVRPAHDEDFADVVLGSAVPVVVGFCAADRPAACEPLISVLEELAAAADDIGVVRVDVDDAPTTSAAYGISVVPSIVVFNAGTMVLALPGTPSRETVQHLLRVAVSPSTSAPQPG